jgi:hypothetical protein
MNIIFCTVLCFAYINYSGIRLGTEVYQVYFSRCFIFNFRCPLKLNAYDNRLNRKEVWNNYKYAIIQYVVFYKNVDPKFQHI